MPNLRAEGESHEIEATRMLLEKGYVIVTRNFHAKGGEIDIVALDGETLVFVEVRFRSQGAPEATVGDRKASRCATAAAAYIAATGEYRRPTRFDFIAMTNEGAVHYEGAFQAP